mmetsp:Transcript_25248/g.56914  ORF Transcript_25248/g.56914 Transcript_25248/m.56914 type:complete len:269 (+) Transcript_25248:314-1120(+)
MPLDSPTNRTLASKESTMAQTPATLTDRVQASLRSVAIKVSSCELYMKTSPKRLSAITSQGLREGWEMRRRNRPLEKECSATMPAAEALTITSRSKEAARWMMGAGCPCSRNRGRAGNGRRLHSRRAAPLSSPLPSCQTRTVVSLLPVMSQWPRACDQPPAVSMQVTTSRWILLLPRRLAVPPSSIRHRTYPSSKPGKRKSRRDARSIITCRCCVSRAGASCSATLSCEAAGSFPGLVRRRPARPDAIPIMLLLTPVASSPRPCRGAA